MAQQTALITNDDGIDSPGLVQLARLAHEAGFKVLVVAPDRESSGASAALNALESHGKLLTDPRELPGLADVEAYAVRATPAFISFIACHDGFGDVDLVLSGVNRGPNTGSAVTHSGTVGAAITAALHERPAVAVSMQTFASDGQDWANLNSVVAPILAQPDRLPVGAVVNINVPDVEAGKLRGTRIAPLASFGAVEVVVRERGTGFLTLTLAEIEAPEEDSDAGLLARGYATLTALSPISAHQDVDLSSLLAAPEGHNRS